MKKFLVLFAGLVILSTALAGSPISGGLVLAQEEYILSANLLYLDYGMLNLECDWTLNLGNSLTGRIFYWGYNEWDWSWSALGVGASYRFYRGEDAPRGFFYGPTVDLLFLSAEYLTEEYDWDVWRWVDRRASDSATFTTVGFEVGYRWIFENRFNITLGAGLGYTSGNLVLIGSKIPLGNMAWRGLKANVGYTF